MLINGLRIAQRIEIIKPLSTDSLNSLKSSSSNTLTTNLEDSDDNPVIHDMSKTSEKLPQNVILAPLKNTVEKFKM